MKRHIYAAIIASTAGLVLCATARADGPDYDGTVSYIKSRVSGSLTEQKQCVFGAKMRADGHERTFHAGALDLVPTVITPSEVHFECRKSARCISLPNADAATVLTFAVHDDAEGVAVAISRLVEMCAGH